MRRPPSPLRLLAWCVAAVAAADVAPDACHAADDCIGETVLLQTRLHLDHGNAPEAAPDLDLQSAGTRDVHSTCPLQKFDASLAWLFERKLFEASNVTTTLARAAYEQVAQQVVCEVGPGWSLSQ